MANSKKLQKRSKNFRRTEPQLHMLCSMVLKQMSDFIFKSGAPEVIAYAKSGSITEIYAND